MSFRLGERSLAMLQGVHPRLVAVVKRAIELSAVDFSVTEGVRSTERQIWLYEHHFSQVRSGGTHEIQKDGFGHAVDVMAVGDLNGDGVKDHRDTSLTWEREPYTKIAAAMKAAALELGVSIRWGGDYKSFFDGPHFELWPAP